jgi:hypothetical protein
MLQGMSSEQPPASMANVTSTSNNVFMFSDSFPCGHQTRFANGYPVRGRMRSKNGGRLSGVLSYHIRAAESALVSRFLARVMAKSYLSEGRGRRRIMEVGLCRPGGTTW